jgi:hypothetical protein
VGAARPVGLQPLEPDLELLQLADAPRRHEYFDGALEEGRDEGKGGKRANHVLDGQFPELDQWRIADGDEGEGEDDREQVRHAQPQRVASFSVGRRPRRERREVECCCHRRIPPRTSSWRTLGCAAIS